MTQLFDQAIQNNLLKFNLPSLKATSTRVDHSKFDKKVITNYSETITKRLRRKNSIRQRYCYCCLCCNFLIHSPPSSQNSAQDKVVYRNALRVLNDNGDDGVFATEIMQVTCRYPSRNLITVRSGL